MNQKNNELVSNRRATFQYEILDTYEAGIVLQGTEIKSLRAHGGNLQDSYVKIVGSELWLVGCNIAPYKFGNVYNHEEKRERKLLMHKREIARLKIATQEKGLTIIPLSFYLKEGRCKVKLAVAKGKKNFDKRASIKERDDQRQMQKSLKQHQQND